MLDTRLRDEDEAVLGVCNMDASVARAGWFASGPSSSSCSTAAPFPADYMHLGTHRQEGTRDQEMRNEKREGGAEEEEEAELNVKEERARGMGWLWSVSDMQGVAIWNENVSTASEALWSFGQAASAGTWPSRVKQEEGMLGQGWEGGAAIR